MEKEFIGEERGVRAWKRRWRQTGEHVDRQQGQESKGQEGCVCGENREDAGNRLKERERAAEWRVGPFVCGTHLMFTWQW